MCALQTHAHTWRLCKHHARTQGIELNGMSNQLLKRVESAEDEDVPGQHSDPHENPEESISAGGHDDMQLDKASRFVGRDGYTHDVKRALKTFQRIALRDDASFADPAVRSVPGDGDVDESDSEASGAPIHVSVQPWDGVVHDADGDAFANRRAHVARRHYQQA